MLDVKEKVVVELQPDVEPLTLLVDRGQLITAQKTDATLSPCFSLVTDPKCHKSGSYLVDDEVDAPLESSFWSSLWDCDSGGSATAVSSPGARFGS